MDSESPNAQLAQYQCRPSKQGNRPVKPRPVIALVTTSFPIAGDGREAAGGFVADLAAALAARVDVRVVAPGPREEAQTFEERIEVFRFKAPHVPLSTLNPWRPSQALQILEVLRSGQRALDRATADERVIHILALWALPSGHWARRAGKATGTPYSVWTLGSDIWSLGKIPLLDRYLARILRDADRCYSDGLQLARDTEALGARAVDFLPSTRSLESARVEAVRYVPPYRLIFLGRWHPNKGIDLLFDALGLLDQDDWNRIESIRVFGGGPMEHQVRAAVDGLQQQGRPIQLGSYLSKAEAEAEILRSDFLLIPSRIESIPVVFSDSIKLRTPVISMPAGDLKDLVALDCGILSPSIDAEGLATAIRTALSEDASRFHAGLERASQAFSLKEHIVPRLLEELVEGSVPDEH